MLSCEEHPVAVNHVGFLYSLLLSFFRSLLISSGASFLQVRIFCDRKLLDLELNFSQRIPISNILPDDGLQFTKFIHRTLKVDTTRLCVGGWISPLTVAGGLCWKLLWLFNHTHQVLLPTSKRNHNIISQIQVMHYKYYLGCPASAAATSTPYSLTQVCLHINFQLTRCLDGQSKAPNILVCKKY